MASIATLMALPAIITANRDSSDQRPATVAAAGAPGIEAGAQIAAAAPTTASSASVVVAPTAATSATANVATSVPVLQERGRATFHQYDDAVWGASSCAHGAAPLGTVITIRNLDTGQTATCVVRDRVDPATGFSLDVDTEVFAQFGDLATGVAPVGISW